MVKRNEMLTYGIVGAAAIILLSKGKVGNFIGQSVGETVGGAVSGSVIGVTKGLLINPYDWARNYEGYIPIIDDAAKAAVGFKRLGNPNAWWS